MKRFLLRTVVALVVFTTVMSALQVALLHRAGGRQFEAWADFNRIKAGGIDATVLVMGNSRARNQYDMRVMEGELHAPTYNLGMIGYPIGDQLAKLRWYLRSNAPPKLIVFNVDPASYLHLERDTILHYEQFLDNINDSLVLAIVRDKVGYRWTDRLPFMRYSGFPDHVWKIIAGDTITNDHDGYVPLEAVMNRNVMRLRPTVYDGDTALLGRYLRTIRAHRARWWPGIPVLYVASPVFQAADDPLTRDLAPMIDGTFEHVATLDLDFVLDQKNFKDRTHLNQNGAPVFSQRVARTIEPLLPVAAH